MRIALVSHEVAGFRGGGIGTYVVEAGRALKAAGHEVWLVTAAPAPHQVDALRAHDAFTRVRFVEDATTPRHEVRFALARRSLWFAQLAFDLLKGSGVAFDYVEFPDYEAPGAVAVPEQRLFGSLGDAVVAVVLHSPTHECWQWNDALHVMGPSVREVAVLEDDTIRSAPVVWSPSTRLAELVAQRLRLPADFADVVRYPMAFDATPPPPPPRAQLTDVRFLFFGRLEPRKGIRRIVDAFAAMPELSIECIGRDGPTSPFHDSEVAWLRRRAVPNVTLTPPLPRTEMLTRLRAADVVVLPSPWDNWPNTCIEAMANARVVVGGRNGGMAEMIEHGRSGFLVDGADADADDLVRVIREDVAAALPRLDAIGAQAARRIREISEPARYVAAIERIVAKHRGRGRLPATPQSTSTKVTIVVPYHREDAAIVGEAIDSAIAQTHRDVEILLVDDGSPRADATEILAAQAGKDARVRVLRKQNGGLASARNFAIEQAAGDALLFLDADNVLRPDYAATGVDVFARCPDVFAISPRLSIFDERTRASQTIIQGLPFDRPLAVFRNSLGDAGAMFRRSVFDVHGLRYDAMVDVYSDWAMWLDLARLRLRVQVVPRVLYDYRLRAGSMMDEQAWERHLALLGLLIEHHLPRGDGTDERELLTTLVQGWGVGALLASLGRRPEFWEAPSQAARRLRHDAMRYRFAEALGKVADKLPPLRALAHHALLVVSRLHGRWKDRRRGDRPV
jgi:glycosyltransferase involved in cell wall biosynthesis